MSTQITHSLTLLFERILNEEEWREIVTHVSKSPLVQGLHANAIMPEPVEGSRAIALHSAQQLYETARNDFRTLLGRYNLDDDAKEFAESLLRAIGEVSPDEAITALERFIVSRRPGGK